MAGQVPTCVAEAPIPAVVANALPGFHAESIHTARKGHALVTQGTLPARLAPVGVKRVHVRVGRGDEGVWAAFCGIKGP